MDNDNKIKPAERTVGIMPRTLTSEEMSIAIETLANVDAVLSLQVDIKTVEAITIIEKLNHVGLFTFEEGRPIKINMDAYRQLHFHLQYDERSVLENAFKSIEKLLEWFVKFHREEKNREFIEENYSSKTEMAKRKLALLPSVEELAERRRIEQTTNPLTSVVSSASSWKNKFIK